MNRLCTILMFLLLSITTIWGKIQLPEIIGNNMVLQQNTSVKLWGKASANVRVTVKVSWDKKEYMVLSDSKGYWSLQIKTPHADYNPKHIDISDGESIRIDNILIGEVWFCSGQSNMEMPLGGFVDSVVEGGNASIASADLKKGIRMVNIVRKGAPVPQNECGGSWQVCNTENAQYFSAVGFYFAERLNQILDVPIGIINCSWGGSCIETWLPREIVSNYQDIDLSEADAANAPNYHCGVPTIMYNGMISPLKEYTIKGFLWYQGEANVWNYSHYAERMTTLVKQWRKDWGLGDLPFYMAEIAPFEYEGKENIAAFLREEQYKAAALLPNCGIICTNDLVYPYEKNQIHPCQKKEVGDRFAYMALNKSYGYKGIACDSPVYKEMQIQDDKVIIHFENLTGFASYHEYTGFEIAGTDRIFYPAKAKTDYQTNAVIVWSEQVHDPVAVRYCFKNFQLGNLKTNRGLPVAPFRTDNF